MPTTKDANDPRLGYGIDESPVDQMRVYLVSDEGEFVRLVRYSYRHTVCGSITTMAKEIATTYAKNPKFYGATYCCGCMKHRPVSEFVWVDDGEVVGS